MMIILLVALLLNGVCCVTEVQNVVFAIDTLTTVYVPNFNGEFRWEYHSGSDVKIDITRTAASQSILDANPLSLSSAPGIITLVFPSGNDIDETGNSDEDFSESGRDTVSAISLLLLCFLVASTYRSHRVLFGVTCIVFLVSVCYAQGSIEYDIVIRVPSSVIGVCLGNECQCVEESDSVCANNGVCEGNICQCDNGYTGKFCTTSTSGIPTYEYDDWTYAIEEAFGASIDIWTAPPASVPSSDDSAPVITRSGVHISAAKNEFEPLQIVIGPGNGEITVAIDDFPNLGDGHKIDFFYATFTDSIANTLIPFDDVMSLDSSNNNVIWADVYVSSNAISGLHNSVLHITHNSVTVDIPFIVYVFDFNIPKSPNFFTQMNYGISQPEEEVKDMLFDHRMTPKSVSWPSGFSYKITWDSDSNPDKCNSFYDEFDEGEAYSIKYLSRKYVLGEGWNDVGFPSNMLFQFIDNNTPRPDTFCGNSRGSDHYGNADYNVAYQNYLKALSDYLSENGMLSKSYYYVQNEPQTADDDALAAFLCRLVKEVAPNLRIAISEEPKRSIAEDNGGACGYDIWIAHLSGYEKTYAWSRQLLGEQVWLYSLPQDAPPFFNPTIVSNTGLHARIIPWISWTLRVTGFAYYDVSTWINGGVPNIRGKLLREGFEDYEYLFYDNLGYPVPNVNNNVDETVSTVGSSLTSWTQDANAFYTLRHKLGQKIQGTLEEYPTLELPVVNERTSYYINFQDPEGEPTAEPLVVDDQTWLKVGWISFESNDDKYGWVGSYIDNPEIALYSYDQYNGVNELDKSYIFDDYGRKNTFEFSLPNGYYTITVLVGRPSGSSDRHNLIIEGTVVVDDELLDGNSGRPVNKLVTHSVNIQDGRLTLEVGGKSVIMDNYAYTFICYLIIEPSD